MALCPECSSEISDNDVFCPFCGISLGAPTMGGAVEDPSFESTIIMQPPSQAKMESSVDEITRPPNEQEKMGHPTSDDSPRSSDDDIPTPFALRELQSTAGSLDVDAARSGNQLPEGTVFPLAASAEADAPARASFPDEPVEAIPPKINERDSNANTLEQVIEVAAAGESHSSHSSDENDAAPSDGDRLVSETSSEEPEISRPTDLPVVDEPLPARSAFDSVRIVEDRDAAPEQAFPEPSVSGPVDPDDSRVRPTDVPPPQENRSHTSSKIGAADTGGRKTAKLKPLEEGALLNSRYEIVRKIGGGGMGAVYLSSDNNLGGVLRAVKEMVQAHIEEEQQDKAIKDFRRESMILSTLDHPSIPTIYDYFFDDTEGRFYLVMKYISGGDLAARLRAAPEGKIDERTVTEWAIQIADVLHYLHSQPTTIVYRDLKPSNIMIDGNTGRVMLIDFGIARSIHQREEKGVTAVGTMGYAPPELFSGNVEPRSDIYSLGSTMFHLLTGADPQSNPLLIFDFQKNPRPRQINPQLSDQMERILMRSVEYNAAARFGSAAEFRQVLDDHLQNLKRGNVTYGVKDIPASVSLANQSVFCGFCGQKIVATDLFCAFCGAKQPIAQHGVHSEIYAPAALTAKLLVVGTSDLESPIFQLDKSENLLGRRDPMSNIFPEVDLSKYDPQTKISRRHAKIWREGGKFLVEDLGSSNGTVIYTNFSDSLRLLPHQPKQLSSGDKIKLGDTTLHFVLG